MIKISDADLHPHLRARMAQRGITLEEIVYYKPVHDTVVLLTVKARYGKGFLKEGEDDEVRI